MNQQVRRTSSGLAADAGAFLVLCECEDTDCLQRLAVPAQVYDQARADEERFVVATGHEDPGVERLVAGDEYCVVRVSPPAHGFVITDSLPAA